MVAVVNPLVATLRDGHSRNTLCHHLLQFDNDDQYKTVTV